MITSGKNSGAGALTFESDRLLPIDLAVRDLVATEKAENIDLPVAPELDAPEGADIHQRLAAFLGRDPLAVL